MANKWLKVTPSSGSGNSELNNSSTQYKGRKKRTASVISYVEDIDAAKAYSVSQTPYEEFLNVDKNQFSVNQEKNLIQITGKSNSPKLIFSIDEGSDIPFILSENYIINGYLEVPNGSDIPGDVGSKSEFTYKIDITIPENNVGERSGKIYVKGSNDLIIQEVSFTQEISTHKISYFKNEFISYMQKTSEVVEFGGSSTNEVSIPENNEQYTYNFDGWYENNKDLISNSLSLNIGGVNSDRNIYARGSRTVNNYDVDVSIEPVGSGSVEGSGRYPYNSRVRLYATPKVGYSFIKFIDEEDVEFTDNPSFFDVRKDRNIRAFFKIKTYFVSVKTEYRIKESGSYISGDIGGVVNGGGSATHGTLVTLVATPNEGYKFAGWYEGSNLVSDKTSYSFQAEGNKNIVARFQRKWFTIKFVAGEGGFVNPEEVRVEYGGSASSVATPFEGSEFQGWSNGSLSETINIKNVKSDATYSASFGENLYTINYSKGEGISSLSRSSETVIHGNTAQGCIAEVENGYEFDGWYSEGVKVSSSINYVPQNVTKSFEVIAKAKLKKFNVSSSISYRDGDNVGSFIQGSNGGSVIGEGEYDFGSSMTLTAVPNVGYEFVGWYDSEGSELSTELQYNVINITENIVIYSRFQKKWFTVTYKAGEGVQEFLNESTRVAYGGNVTSERIVLLENYTSPKWELESGSAILNVSGVIATLSNVLSDCTLLASAVLEEFKITYSKNESFISLQKDSEIVKYGMEATNLASIPENNSQYSYNFDGWYEGENLVTSEKELSVLRISSNRLFTAKGRRSLNRYDITVVNGSGSGNYGYGERIVITADNIQGKTFTQWSDGVKSSTREIIVVGEKTYTAEYVDNYLTINYLIGEGIQSLSSFSETVIYGGDAVGCTASLISGYVFDGWYSGSTKVSPSITYAPSNVVSNMSLKAVGRLNLYNIEIVSYYRDEDGAGEYIEGSEGGLVSGGGEVVYGRSVTLVASPKEGYKFVGWYDSESGGNLVSSSMNYTIEKVIKNEKLYARFQKKWFTVTYKIGNQYVKSLSRTSERVVYGGDALGCEMFVLDNTPEFSYTPEGWYNNGGALVSSDAEFIPQNVTSDIGYIAKGKSEINGINVTYIKGENIYSINRNSEVVLYGRNGVGCRAVLPPIEEEYHYEFDGWYEGEEKVGSELLFIPENVTEEKTYEVRGLKVTNDVNIQVSFDEYSSGRGVLSGGGIVQYGEETSISITLNNDGDIFDGWYENGEKVSSDLTYTFVVNKSRSLVAKVLFVDVNPSVVSFTSSGGSKSIRINSSTGFILE